MQEEYIVVPNERNITSDYLVGRREQGKVFPSQEVRYNSLRSFMYPNKRALENGIPQEQAIIFKKTPTHLGDSGKIGDDEGLLEEVIEKVIKKQPSKDYHPVKKQNHEKEKAWKFLRENFYCFKNR